VLGRRVAFAILRDGVTIGLPSPNVLMVRRENARPWDTPVFDPEPEFSVERIVLIAGEHRCPVTLSI
jgi:hypothetical protein